jgi:hypothetical protein
LSISGIPAGGKQGVDGLRPSPSEVIRSCANGLTVPLPLPDLADEVIE